MIWGNVQVRKSSVWRRAALAALVCASFALALPALASAAGFEVNGNGDGTNQAECESASGADECTLRGAIEATEAAPGLDQIEFSSAVFHGEVGESEIAVGPTPLPTITQPLTISGQAITGGPFVRPSVGVTAPAGFFALKVEANEVTLENVAIGGGEPGVWVVGSADRFVARGDWFGLKLDATANPIAGAGLVLATGSDEATIGGTVVSERNVFANADVGVELKGASKTKIRGNYIGVQPDGTDAAGLGTGVRIEDFAAPAENNEVGGALSAGEVATEECVGPCNAITTENGSAIELAGPLSDPQQAAHGPTFIRGNYLGVEPDGVGTVGELDYGVLAAPSEPGCSMPGPGDVTVGGVAPGERNYIAGGIFGAFAESAENFSAIGNWFGVGPDETGTATPILAGVGLCNSEVTEASLVAGNRMGLDSGAVGVQSSSGHAQIVGNFVFGGDIGVLAIEENEGAGDLIGYNQLVAQDLMGIEIANDSNVVVGNQIRESGRSGILVDTDANHNRIGGDASGEANSIAKVSGPEPEDGAITIFGRETGRNEIASNTGSLNVGAFIKLLPHGGMERPNGGIQPPVFGAVHQSSASGTAEPNATMRIFGKQTPELGELGPLLAVVKADAGGAWTATYATQAVGTLITATQTREAGTPEAGTSVLAAPVAASVDPVTPEEPKPVTTLPSNGNPLPNPPSVKAPKVRFTAAPKKIGTATTARFRFKAEPAAGARFECKLDRAKWARCSSPRTYRRLKPGRHTFRVRAKAVGLTGAVSRYTFMVRE